MKKQRMDQISSGLIGVWSYLEQGSSYRAMYCSENGFPQRLQTWFPYHIKVCLNGREWLRRGLERAGIDCLVHGNKFLYIADYQKAQQLIDEQLNTQFTNLLNSFSQRIFPDMEKILGPHLSYYWTLWQSEWSTDLIFDTPQIHRLICYFYVNSRG